MKKFLLLLLSVFLAASASQNPRLSYIEKYSGLAINEMKRTGVPASITLAQALIESNAGLSTLAVKANNHFGIKCHNDWKGKTMNADDDAINECFRVYPSEEASFKDHSDFLRFKDRYKFLFDLDPKDYEAWSKGLKKAGYATDPNYAAKLIKVIEDYELYRFDGGVQVSIPSPQTIETPQLLSPDANDLKYKEFINISMSRTVYIQNGVPFIYSIEGETFNSIAESNQLFLKEILRFNDLDTPKILEPGTIVYLSKKKKEAAAGVDKYVVEKDGETLYEISQRFAVRLACLQKLNIVLYNTQLQEGDTILLR